MRSTPATPASLRGRREDATLEQDTWACIGIRAGTPVYSHNSVASFSVRSRHENHSQDNPASCGIVRG